MTPEFLTTMNELSSNSVSENEPSTSPSKRPLTGKGSGKKVFQPGVSGNPAGRPRGSKNQITLLKLSLEQALREQAAPKMGEVLEKAFEMALKGHPGMIKLLLELHVSKTSENAEHKSADDKITININGMDNKEKVISQTKPAIEGELDNG